MSITTTAKTFFDMKKVSLFKSLMLAYVAIPLASFASFAELPKVIFEENKNQWPSQVKFKADIAGGALFLEQNTFTYVLKENINWHRDHRNESGGPVTQKQHAFKVIFENSNPNSEILGNNQYSWHRNYYLGNDRSKWASDVSVFSQVYYKDLYENIDLQYYNDEATNLKYDIIVHPGGNPKSIKLNYVGTDGMELNTNGHLFIKTSIYDIIEQKPYAYQVINGDKKQVECAYVLKNEKLSFSLGSYDPTLPLIIDPTLIACTYSGSTADNWGFTATYDAAGNIYMGGIISGTGYPTTTGAHDSSYNGGISPGSGSWPFDIFLAKFNPTGTSLLYATYYGGGNNEQPHSLVVNSSNQLYVVGRTNSSNFPTTVGAYDNIINGGYDIIVGKFNGTGGILGSTFVGGSSDDCVNVNIGWDTYGTTKFSYTDDGRSEIIIDASSNVYIAANTKSSNFPTAGTPYQSTFGGIQDAVVFSLNSNLTALTWSTYLGGTGTDAAYGLKLDNSNNVYVTGGTTGGTFPTTAGVLHPTYQGGLTDAFISVFNPSLSGPAELLRSTFLGTAAYDQAYMIEIDASGDLYVYGQTQGAYPVTAGVYTNPNSGQFIHKVTGSLAATVFSTVIGTGGNAVNISPTAFLVDSCQTIYIAGWARSSVLSAFMPSPSTCTGMPVTANAQQSTTDGKDHYFMVLEPDAKGLFYATFYGEGAGNPDADHVDGGTCRFDKRGVIYQACCASCGGTQGFPVMAGAYSISNNSNHINHPLPTSPNQTVFNCNEAVVKMDVSVNPVAKANITSASTGCAPFTVTFDTTGSKADNFIWDFGDGGTSTVGAPSYTYNFAGTYSITLFAIDSIGICGYIDTSIVAVTVGKAPTLTTTATNFLCNPGVSSATVTATSGLTPYTYAWSPSGGNANIATGLTTGGIYTVSVTDAGGCTSTKTVNITQPTPLTIAATTTASVCSFPNGAATASVTGGSPGYSYNWSGSSQTSATITGMAAGVYTVTVTDNNGCTKPQAIIIGSANGPTVTATATGTIACNGGTTGAVSSSTVGGTPPLTYQWSPGTAGTNPSASGLTGGTYFIVVTDSIGCVAVDSVNLPEPGPLTISIVHTPAACATGNNGTAPAIVNGGTAPYSYSWGGTSPVQTTATATGLTAGTYTLTVTDSKGCTNTATTTITSQPNAVIIDAFSTGTACGPNSNVVITTTVWNGTPNYSYVWAGVSTATTPNISNALGGSYTVTVTDGNNCTAVDTITVPNSAPPTADFTFERSISCEGITYQFTSTSINALTYEWNIPGVGSSTDANPSFLFPYSGTYNVTLIVTNPPCKDTLTMPVVVGNLGTDMEFKEANVFTPNDDGLNDCFHPAMINMITGLADEVLLPCIHLVVFDRWGVKMFESLGVNGKNCWNGQTKSDSKSAPDGTYFWIATLGETTLKGYVTLARHK